ncbi:SseB family protein [Pontibaca salina]|uniref:SseB family protein n=1 Tax=Pontibaca salina TaxID=2795731 RepID=A0A934M094_9RHOB|nr:SseB family protein [Pontibaca salina]MBI6629518.1 SseB family protein [Pontibaca salina]
MTEITPLDDVHAAMQAAPTDDAARLRFYERLGDSELFLLLKHEAEGDDISPELFDLDAGRFLLAFDREERLSQFAGGAAAYAAMSGRILARMLAGQQLGLALNLEVAPSSILIPADAIEWLDHTLGHAPSQIEARIEALHPPTGLPESLLTALDTKLANARGLASCAYLVGVTYRGGGRGHLLAFLGALEGAESALAKAASEALTFSGVAAGALDVGFFAPADPITATLAAQGLRFDLPQPAREEPAPPIAPGSDPDRPPILR